MSLVRYEDCVWLSWMHVGPGLALRKLFWPNPFGSCGKDAQFGTNITVVVTGALPSMAACTSNEEATADHPVGVGSTDGS